MGFILVDSNIHPVAPPKQRDVYPLDSHLGAASSFQEHETNPVDDILRNLDDAGIHQAYLSASRFHGFDNSYCADVLPGHLDRFVGIANIDPFAVDAAHQISYWIEQRGMHGVRFWGGDPGAVHRFPDASGRADYVDDPRLRPAWDRIRDLGVPVNAQATMPEVLPNTRRLLERYPELPLTFINLARVPVNDGTDSEAAQALLALAEFPRTYVNFSAGFIQETQRNQPALDLLHALLERFGPRRLLWTTFGIRMKESAQTVLDGLAFLPEQARAEVLGEGARDLYPSLRQHLPI